MNNGQMVDRMDELGYARDQQCCIRGEKTSCGWHQRWMALKEGQNCVVGARNLKIYYRVPEKDGHDQEDHKLCQRTNYLAWTVHASGTIVLPVWLQRKTSGGAAWKYVGRFAFGPVRHKRNTVMKRGKPHHANRMRELVPHGHHVSLRD